MPLLLTPIGDGLYMDDNWLALTLLHHLYRGDIEPDEHIFRDAGHVIVRDDGPNPHPWAMGSVESFLRGHDLWEEYDEDRRREADLPDAYRDYLDRGGDSGGAT